MFMCACVVCFHVFLCVNFMHTFSTYIFFCHHLSVVSIATCYGLDDPGIKSWWGRDFLHTSRPALGPPSLLYNGYRVSIPQVKPPECGTSHPPPSSAKVKERVELYFRPPLWAFVACARVSFTLTLDLTLPSFKNKFWTLPEFSNFMFAEWHMNDSI
jgi:hypothetical protein